MPAIDPMASSRKVRPRRCAEHFALIGSKGYADTEFTETLADGIGGHAEDASDGKHRAQQAKHAERNGGYASGEEVESNSLFQVLIPAAAMDPGCASSVAALRRSLAGPVPIEQ